MVDEDVGDDERVAIVNHFTQQLHNSGYNRSQITEIIVCGLKGRVKKEEEIKERGRRFRNAEETLNERTRKKLLEANSWYKDRTLTEEEKREREKDQSLPEYQKDELLSLLHSSSGNWRKGARRKRTDKEKLEELLDAGKSPSKGSKEKIQGVLFVQHMEHSKLAQNIREKLRLLETVGIFKFKIVERTGETLVDLLHKSSSWGK